MRVGHHPLRVGREREALLLDRAADGQRLARQEQHGDDDDQRHGLAARRCASTSGTSPARSASCRSQRADHAEAEAADRGDHDRAQAADRAWRRGTETRSAVSATGVSRAAERTDDDRGEAGDDRGDDPVGGGQELAASSRAARRPSRCRPRHGWRCRSGCTGRGPTGRRRRRSAMAGEVEAAAGEDVAGRARGSSSSGSSGTMVRGLGLLSRAKFSSRCHEVVSDTDGADDLAERRGVAQRPEHQEVHHQPDEHRDAASPGRRPARTRVGPPLSDRGSRPGCSATRSAGSRTTATDLAA